MKLHEEFVLYEKMWDNLDTLEADETAKVNSSFFMVLRRTPEKYSIEALTNNEAAAREAYNNVIAKLKTKLDEDEALILVKVFDLAIYEKIKPFVGKGFIEDKRIDNMLDIVLDSNSDALEYYEPADEEDETNRYRVVLADYDTDDFDINVEFGLLDPDNNEVVDAEFLLKPGQTRGDLVVYLSKDCGFTSIYVHDERLASSSDIKRLESYTFPVTGTGDSWEDYGNID